MRKTWDERVSNCKKFSQKSITIVGTKKSRKEIRAPVVRMEVRPDSGKQN